MAQGKKSFVIYTSWQTWLAGLNTTQKGQWLEWIMAYCNDMNPELPKDQAVTMACLMAKEQLKRDLNKWEEIKKVRSEAGKKHTGNQYTRLKQNGTNGTDNVNVNVNDNVNVNVNDNVKT